VEKIFIFGSPVLFPKRLDGGSGASARGGKTAATEQKQLKNKKS